MKVTATTLPGVLILEPVRHGDARGFFLESWNEREFQKATGVTAHFVQDNHSRSAGGVLRGLHWQVVPHAQGKLVRVVAGEVFDVAADVRPDSPTFGQWAGVALSGDNCRQLWIPPGYAHGFLVLSEHADFLYKTTDYYHPEAERSIRWDDPTLGIQWPLRGAPTLSARDAQAPLLPNRSSS
jgi:dTDP-4-dehydrorhamnose 3,5-epimerase